MVVVGIVMLYVDDRFFLDYLEFELKMYGYGVMVFLILSVMLLKLEVVLFSKGLKGELFVNIYF